MISIDPLFIILAKVSLPTKPCVGALFTWNDKYSRRVYTHVAESSRN